MLIDKITKLYCFFVLRSTSDLKEKLKKNRVVIDYNHQGQNSNNGESKRKFVIYSIGIGFHLVAI